MPMGNFQSGVVCMISLISATEMIAAARFSLLHRRRRYPVRQCLSLSAGMKRKGFIILVQLFSGQAVKELSDSSQAA